MSFEGVPPTVPATMSAMLEAMRDVRFGLRLMRKRPALSLLIIFMLASGIGISVAVFGVIDAFLLRPLPFREAGRLVEVLSQRGESELGVSYDDYLDWRERSRSFVDLAFFHSDFAANLTAGGGTEPVRETLTTANLFPLLGVSPSLGRWLLPADDRPGAECVALLSFDLWRTRFGADPQILGRRIVLEGGACGVIGVMPAEFRFPSQTDVWSSIGPFADRNYRLVRYDSVLGRLRQGVSLAQARDEMARVAVALARQYPLTNDGIAAKVVPLRDIWVGDIRVPLILLFGACALVLLLTCANAANLLLGRALGREHEIAVRIALGADRARLVRQLVAENLLLAACSGVSGLMLGGVGVAAARGAIPVALPSWVALRLDWTAAAFAAAISAMVGLLFGLAPVLQLGMVEVTGSLKVQQAAGSSRRHRLRSSLVVLEIALALVLLVGAKLMVTSFLRLQKVDPGFHPAKVLVEDVNLAFHQGEVSATRRFSQLAQVAVARVTEVPGIEAAAAVVNTPLTGENVLDRFEVTLFGQTPEEQLQNPTVNFRRIGPDYFRCLRIGLVRGRVFTQSDAIGSARVAVLGERAAHRLWAHEDAVGRRLKLGPPASAGSWITVVGVVRDVHQEKLAGEPGFDLFVPILQAPGKLFTILARTHGDPGTMAGAVRRALVTASPEIGVMGTTTMSEVVARSIWVPRVWGWLFGLFSLFSLLLAAAGTYGVMTSSVRERTREIGVRMALGAERSSVLALVLGSGLKLALTGAVIGVALAAALTGLLRSVAFEVNPGDPGTLIEVAGLMILAALLASWSAARRASQVDPVIALRSE